jgi:hypothetical protein
MPAERSAEGIGKWFARVYNEEKVFERGTSLKRESSARIYSRGPETYSKGLVRIKSFQKRGNYLEVRVTVTGPVFFQRGRVKAHGGRCWSFRS